MDIKSLANTIRQHLRDLQVHLDAMVEANSSGDKNSMQLAKANFEGSHKAMAEQVQQFDQSDRKPQTVDDQRTAFEAAQSKNTVAAWDEFLAKYPTGEYSARARSAKANVASKQ